MPSLSNVRASNASYSPSYVPTAVFVGGTSGLGQAMAEIFAEQTGGRANIIIVGRDQSAADKIIARFPSPSNTDGITFKHEFIYCDATLMKNVHDVAQQIISKVDKINYLVCSIGGLTFSRKETEEGNEASLALRVYARFKFFHELLPLVQKAKDAGEDAKMMSILGAGEGGPVDLEDMELTNFSMTRGNAHSGTYTDIMIKVLSEQHPDLTFIHIFPGVVDTPALRIAWWSTIPAIIFSPFLRKPRDAGNFLLYPILDQKLSSGAFYFNKDAEKLAFPDWITGELKEKVWNHILSRAHVQQ